MPVLKQIAGHTSCAPVRRYLEKGGRALAVDLFGFDEWDERDALGRDPAEKAAIDWAAEMDAVRRESGNDLPWRGRPARTFKHFVISPAPGDGVALEDLRALAAEWVAEHFADFQAAVVYHDDNAGRIPHAHVVVNNTNMETGARMHHDDPRELNRSLQRMAAARGLSALSNAPAGPAGGLRGAPAAAAGARARTLQAARRDRAERGMIADGRYSWVADIRGRAAVAKSLASSEREYLRALRSLGVEARPNSPRSRRPDWVYSLAGAPSRRISGERLGAGFGKAALDRRFARAARPPFGPESGRALLRRARKAVELGDLGALRLLARSLELAERHGARTAEDCGRAVARLEARSKSAPTPQARGAASREAAELSRARDLLRDMGVMPARGPKPPAAAAPPRAPRGGRDAGTPERAREARAAAKREGRDGR